MEAFNLIKKGIIEGVFPGAVAAWGPLNEPPKLAWAGRFGKSRFRETPVTPEAVYDLASLTKVLSTTILLMKLAADNKLDCGAPLSQTPLAEKADSPFWSLVSPASLLSHQAGLPAWQPYYLHLAQVPPKNRSLALMKAIIETKRTAAVPPETVYSDLGFMLLGFLVESFYGQPLDKIFENLISRPLGLNKQIGYHPLNWAPSHLITPTEDGSRLGGPLDFPGLPRLPEVPVGIAHDDNANWLGGVAGHAGLFGTVGGVWRLLSAIFNGRSTLADEPTIQRFIRPPALEGEINAARAWGFAFKSSVSEAICDSNWSPRTIGHLGYTGTSFWYDPATNFAAIFLSNRVHPTAANTSINCFRPVFYRFTARQH